MEEWNDPDSLRQIIKSLEMIAAVSIVDAERKEGKVLIKKYEERVNELENEQKNEIQKISHENNTTEDEDEIMEEERPALTIYFLNKMKKEYELEQYKSGMGQSVKNIK